MKTYVKNKNYHKVYFPKFLKPKKNFLLKRLGKDNDGGYLVDINSLKAANTLISLGISDDWSFELNAQKENKNINIVCYDLNTSFIFLFKIFIKKLFFVFFYGIKETVGSFAKICSYFFFLKKKIFVKKITYNDLIIITKKLKPPFFLKIDIEVSEYRILDDLLKLQNKISGIVIEFHDIDLFQDKIKDFISKFKLELVHIHANNCGILWHEANVIELTFSKNPVISGTKINLPHKYDHKNLKHLPEILIKFK
jgi:hypothetical protein